MPVEEIHILMISKFFRAFELIANQLLLVSDIEDSEYFDNTTMVSIQEGL